MRLTHLDVGIHVIGLVQPHVGQTGTLWAKHTYHTVYRGGHLYILW
jgi:hypothetical protein